MGIYSLLSKTEDTIIETILACSNSSADTEGGLIEDGDLDGWHISSGMSDLDLNHEKKITVLVSTAEPAEDAITQATGNVEMKASIHVEETKGPNYSKEAFTEAAELIIDLVYATNALELLEDNADGIEIYRWFPLETNVGVDGNSRVVSQEVRLKARTST